MAIETQTVTFLCEVCGQPIPEPFDSRGRARKCCSPSCRGKKRLTKEQRSLIPKFRNTGMKVSVIATRLGVTPEAVRWHLKSKKYRSLVIARVNEKNMRKKELKFQEMLKDKMRILSEHERGFIEGMIEGEGCLTMYGRPSGWDVSLVIASTTPQLLERIHQVIGSGLLIRHRPKNLKWKPRFTLKFSHNTMRWLLPQLSLITKEKQRLLVLEALSLMRGHGGSKNREIITKRLGEIRDEIQKYNKRGSST